MSTATVDQWGIVHWKWQGVGRLEEKQVLVFPRLWEKRMPFRCLANGIDYGKLLLCMFAFWRFSMGQTWQHRPCCYHEGQVSLTWRVTGQHFTACMAWGSDRDGRDLANQSLMMSYPLCLTVSWGMSIKSTTNQCPGTLLYVTSSC